MSRCLKCKRSSNKRAGINEHICWSKICELAEPCLQKYHANISLTQPIALLVLVEYHRCHPTCLEDIYLKKATVSHRRVLLVPKKIWCLFGSIFQHELVSVACGWFDWFCSWYFLMCFRPSWFIFLSVLHYSSYRRGTQSETLGDMQLQNPRKWFSEELLKLLMNWIF